LLSGRLHSLYVGASMEGGSALVWLRNCIQRISHHSQEPLQHPRLAIYSCLLDQLYHDACKSASK
jgi:hypothetical protein